MQDRSTGDIGDYVKLAIFAALSCLADDLGSAGGFILTKATIATDAMSAISLTQKFGGDVIPRFLIISRLL